MEGAVLATHRDTELAIFGAYHTAVFVLNGYVGKLKPLNDYLGSDPKPNKAVGHAQAIAFFHALKAQGVPVKIYRTPPN